MVVRNLILTFGLLLLFSGCLPKSEDVKSVFQTNSATIIKKDQERLQSLLLDFKKKLDLRNPRAFSEQNRDKINFLIKNSNKKFLLKYKNTVLENYKDYLQLAFSKDDIQIRNDYLILGIYYLIDHAYDLSTSYKVGAFEYDREKLDRLYKNLQIIKWKIKVNKDLNNDYLFLTWQNNWQIEFDKKLRKNKNFSYKKLHELKYIKEKKETILDPSNFSFEVLLTKMIDSAENSLRALGEEPKELTVKAMFLFL